MDGETLKTRLLSLAQKTRKALRLYGGLERQQDTSAQAEFTALQLEQWQELNSDLQRQIITALDRPSQRALGAEVVSIRDHFHGLWRAGEAEIRAKQRQLLSAAEKSDFVHAAVLGRELVSLKAREQAAQAAHHELQDIVTKCRIPQGHNGLLRDEQPGKVELNAPESITRAAVELKDEAVRPVTLQTAKIIPLRRNVGGR